VILVVQLLCISLWTLAQGADLGGAISWLELNQEPSGLWGTGKNAPFRDTEAVLLALSNAGGDPSVIADGMVAADDLSAKSTDYLARKIMTYASVNDGEVSSDLLDSLADLQNSDGGWGYADGYSSNNMETSLALRALYGASNSSTSALISGVSYLISHQNADDGWSFVEGDSSRVFYTAHTIIAMAPLRDIHGGAVAAIENGVDWLKTQAHIDDGFGTGNVSNPYETGLALAAISAVDPMAPEALAVRAYLESTQLPDGSWDDDAYSTAIALMGLLENQNLHGRSLSLTTGLNLLGLPVDPVDPLTSTELCAQIPGCSEIIGWNRYAQDWAIGDFPLEVQNGFFVDASSDATVSTLGILLDDGQCTTLEIGLNAVSIPNENACYAASSLLSEISGCTEVHSWNEELQKWISYATTRGDTTHGWDFAASTGEGFFVRVTSGSEWCTQECDTVTVPEFPDLFISPDDFRIIPNPVTEGQPDTTVARVQNIGTVDVSNPEIVFYMGDPDLGGTQMAPPISIPETIPPGGTSGFYGYIFTWNGSGAVDIYVVADFNNDIEELDENNNKTFHTLTILPATASMTSEVSPQPFTIAPISVQELSVSADLSRTTKRTDGLSLGADSAVISYVSTFNITSSSATISWFTDFDTDGCVNYGTSSPSENTECSYGLWNGLHFIEITNLTANTSFVFEVESGGTVDDNNGSYYAFTTTDIGAGVPSVLYGRVLSEYSARSARSDGKDRSYAFEPGVAVSLAASNGADTTTFIATVTGWDGTWMLNLGNLKDATGFPYAYSSGDEILINANGGSRGSVSTSIILFAGSPQDAGDLVLSAYLCGDANSSGNVDIDDIMFLVNYVFLGGIPPDPLWLGDADCSGDIDIDDIMYLVNYIFAGGPAPCEGC